MQFSFTVLSFFSPTRHPCELEGLVTLSADMHGYWLVSEGRNGRRVGEWWESLEAFTLGDKDQQQNKNRLFCLLGEGDYYKTTEEKGDVQRQRSFMDDSQASGSF